MKRSAAGRGVVLATLMVALVFAGSWAMAQPQPATSMMERCRKRFAIIDTSGDGKISLDEFEQVAHHGKLDPEEVFWVRDLNRDGLLTVKEFCTHRRH